MIFHFHLRVETCEDEELFLNICLPTLLTDGNLQSFRGSKRSEFIIHAGRESARRIVGNRFFHELEQIMLVRIVPTQESPLLSGSINDVTTDDVALVFLLPGMVVADGALARICEIAFSGKRVVGILLLNVDRDLFLPEFTRRFKDRKGHFQVSSRELVSAAIPCLDLSTRKYFLNSESFPEDPSMILWPLGEKELLGRCADFYTLLLHPKNSLGRVEYDTDAQLCINTIPDIKDYKIITDSDEIAIFSITQKQIIPDPDRHENFLPHLFADKFREKFYSHGSEKKIRRNIFQKKIRFQTGSPAKTWNDLEKISDKVIRQILGYAGFLDKYGVRDHTTNIDHVKNVVIFGIGHAGVSAQRFLSGEGLNVAYFVDNNKSRWGDTINGFLINPPDTLINRDFELIIIASGYGRNAIIKQIRNMGFNKQIDYLFFTDMISYGCHHGVTVDVKLDTPHLWDINAAVCIELVNSASQKYAGELVELTAIECVVRIPVDKINPINIGQAVTINIGLDKTRTRAATVSISGTVKRMERDLWHSPASRFMFVCVSPDSGNALDHSSYARIVPLLSDRRR